MSCFKLLAIRPLSGCNRRFLRNLHQGTIYPFYQSYQFLDKNGDPVTGHEELAEISDQSTVLPSLYNINTQDDYELSLTVSAIAGKNGSGKSSLMELFFAVVYAFSVEHNILKPNFQTLKDEPVRLEEEIALNHEEEKKLKNVKNLISSDLKQTAGKKNFESLKLRMTAYAAKEAEIKQKADRISENKKAVARQISEIETFLAQLKAEIYFRLDSTYFRLTVCKVSGEKATTRLSIVESREPWAAPDYVSGTGRDIPIDVESLAEHFFYTIALNYSHYGLNSTVIGNWITNLFHKNDGYTTPLVFNPMRTDGNFDINTEFELAKQRMLLNVLRAHRSENNEKNQRIFATDKQYISSFRFKLNWAKLDNLPKTLRVTQDKITGPSDEVNIFLDFMELHFPGMDLVPLMSSEFALKNILANYIVAKIKKIAGYYPGFQNSGVTTDNAGRKIDLSFLKQLYSDRSHVTYKLNQAVNYFRFSMFSKPGDKLHITPKQLSAKTAVSADFTPGQLFRWMEEPIFGDVADRLPPSLFELDFELMREESPKSSSFFSQLSSGEQQLIHTFQSIFYHLNNIQSAHHSFANRVKYQAINIVFDEIELYFHPEYQRRFVFELLNAFKRYRVGSADSIRSINIILLTHSPFILSDIPAENILLLKANSRGRAMPEKSLGQTFAANINDLLANGFFLKSTLMGSFAEDKIRKVIRKLKLGGQPTEADQAIFELIGDKFLQTNLYELLPENHDQDQNT